MKKIQFEVYIGKNMHREQADDIIAVLILPSDIPKGHYLVNGKECMQCSIGFKCLSLLGNYICDWIEFLEEEKNISAKIYLNKYSDCRVLKGRKIIQYIDELNNV